MEDVIVGAQNTPPTNSRMAVDAGPRDKAGKAVSVPRKTRRSAVDAPRGKAPYSVPPMADPNPDAASTQLLLFVGGVFCAPTITSSIDALTDLVPADSRGTIIRWLQ
jgi:hypothetical protein